jgi:uncharacterized protein YcnI
MLNLKQLAATLTLALVPVLAHATVRTEMGLAESRANAYETYRLQVPVEKPLATVEVRMVVPPGFILSRFLQTPGWERAVVKDAGGNISEVVWKGKVPDGEFVRFIFQGRNPTAPGKLSWKVYQTYEDGSIAAWDDADKEKGPASVVEIK